MNAPLLVLHNAINRVLNDSGRDAIALIQPDMRLKQDLDLDSLDLAVLTVKIEAETGIDVFADGIVETVGQIIEKLER
jgi:acyl carrier protein